MKYGKLEDISGIDFVLPADHPDNMGVLAGKPFDTDFRLGGTMWNIPSWVGRIYPTSTSKSNYIQAYGNQFSTIELNATHYRIPSKETVRQWYGHTPVNFLFCPKFPQTISHYRRFRDCEAVTDDFLIAISEFRDKLGPAFIQLPPNFSAASSSVLVKYLSGLPTDLKYAIEFRHPQWFTGGPLVEEVWQLLRELKITAIISDTAGRRDAMHMRLTTPHSIVRFGGNDLHPSDYSRLTHWVERTSVWTSEGLRSFHLWMHQPESVKTPETCMWFASELCRLTGVEIDAPKYL
jgi:uncharacterized protein YecE (DUF72 family)